MENQNSSELIVELRKPVIRELSRNKNLEDRNILFREIYSLIPEYWKKSIGLVKVVVFRGPITKRSNFDIGRLESRALSGKDVFWSDASFKPRFSQLDWLVDSRNRIIYIRNDEWGHWREDYDVKRDFLMAFGILIWEVKRSGNFHKFCESELVMDYVNPFLGHVPREKEVAKCYPRMSLKKIRTNLKKLTQMVARDNFSRLWQLFISNPRYLKEKMTTVMVIRMQRLDKLMALGKL